MADNPNQCAPDRGLAIAAQAEQALAANPGANLVEIIRTDLAQYKQNSGTPQYDQMVTSMTQKLERDGFLPALSIQAGVAEFDAISHDHKYITKEDLKYQTPGSQPKDSFEAYLMGTARKYCLQNFGELKNEKREGAFGWLTGNSKISRNDMMHALSKNQESNAKNPLAPVAYVPRPPVVRPAEVHKAEPPKTEPPKPVDCHKPVPKPLPEPQVPPMHQFGKKPVPGHCDHNTTGVKAGAEVQIKTGDTLGTIIRAHFGTLPRAEQVRIQMEILQLNSQLKDVNHIKAGSTLRLPAKDETRPVVKLQKSTDKTP